MTTQIVGYRLRNTLSGEIIATWGGTWGQCPAVPGLLIIPQPDVGGEPQLPLQVCGPSVGHTYSGHILEEWMMEEPPPAVPASISRRQFYQMAANAGFITNDEAIAAMAGTIPATILALVDTLPDDASKFTAKMLLTGAQEFDRSNPLVETIGTGVGQTSAQIDQFFIGAALL